MDGALGFGRLLTAKGDVVEPILLGLLRCPETGQGVGVADTDLLERLEAMRRQGSLFDGAGRPVEGLIRGGLVRADGKVFFSVVGGIPVMLMEQAIRL